MPGRQCNQTKMNHGQITGLTAGGQSFSPRDFASANFIQVFGSSLACRLPYSLPSLLAFFRWRRLISPSKAATTNCPVLSPGSFPLLD